MFWLKLTVKSIFCGGGVTLLLTFVCLLAGNRTVSNILLSPLAVLVNMSASPIFRGYEEYGNRIYEGAPTDGFIIISGLILCVVFYSIISFAAFLIINRRRKFEALK